MISVVIPLYNKAHTIFDTLKTVIAQSFTDFEIVIVDDGSTDDSVKVIQDFLLDKRLRVISQTNKGVSAARNKGVEESKFELIAFLDADDKWFPDYLKKMVETIHKFPDFAMYNCAGIVRNADNSKFNRIANKYKDRICEINFFENPHVFLHTSATIVNKSEFNKVKGFPIGMKRNQDLALFYSMALNGKVAYCGYPLSIYIGGVAGQSTSTPFIKVMEHIAKRYNHVHHNYLVTTRKNSNYLIFLKYELRHFFKIILIRKGNKVPEDLLSLLDSSIVKQFSYFEFLFYKNRILKPFAIMYINITKLRWRLRGYPRFNT
jgi:glycosyltransferase involved in cell wall biosynthesis